MRKLLLGLALAVGIRAAWAVDCTDTTFILKAGLPGFTSGNGTGASATYDPAALNSFIRGCTDATVAIHLNLDKTEAAKTKDSVKLAGPILIGGRNGKTTALNMNRTGSTTVIDTLFTFVEGSASPTLLVDSTNNPLVLTNMAFARKAINSSEHTVRIQAKGSQVSACNFWMLDKDSGTTGALVDITADSVLVERSLFRAPPDGSGRSSAIHTGNTATKVEIRANVFFSTGLQLAASGTCNVIANTFVGSRNAYNFIIVGSQIGTNYDYVAILHNLFAAKVDTLPPITFSSTATAITSSSIQRNAWSRTRAGTPLAVVGTSATTVTLNGATGANANIVLPKGYSNYGPNSGDVKDYPLTELRSDPTLARSNPDFGKFYSVFATGSWAGAPIPMADVSTVSSRLFFPGFAPFVPGKSWLANIKVGAFVAQDTIVVPSPLDSGAQGASFKLQKDSVGTDRAKITFIKFDQNYYKQLIAPDVAYFFFNTTLSKLTASNDTNALKAAGNLYVRKSWTGFDSLLTVPKELRSGVDIYVKMLHFKGQFMAPVQSNAVIGTLSNFPSFPVNDLVITQDPANTDAANRRIGIKVTHGSEQIDSVRVLTLNEAGQIVGTDSRPASTSTLSLTITVADKGNYFFQAVPVGHIGSTPKAGSATSSIGPFALGITTSDSVYVTNRTTGCTGADGSIGSPFCTLDAAIAALAGNKGGTIIVRNGNPALPFEDLTIAQSGTDTASITITSGRFDENRPIFRGKTKEALVITRKNVTLRGFTIEQPAGAARTAVVVKAGGCVLDANIFRASAKGSVEAPAISIEAGSSADVRVVNNVIWGFAKGVQFVASSSPNVKILFNTFVADSAINKTRTSGIFLSGTDEVAAVVADNFFSGLTAPIDTTLTGKRIVLDHNVYTAGARLHGLSEGGGLDASDNVPSTNIWVTDYAGAISGALFNVADCSSLTPCNPLYGGSSSNTYNVTVTTDAFGTARKNKKEVGAFEYPSAPSGVLGVVEIHPTLVPGQFSKINFTVSGKAFDPAPEESDSVQVFWTTTDITRSVDANLSNVPASQRRGYNISKLVAGDISDVATVDKETTRYWFYAALSRTTKGTRKLGFPYSDTLTSNANLLFDSCTFALSKTACPSPSGIFGVDSGAWKGKFETRVLLAEPIASGSVKLPRFESLEDVKRNNLDLTSPLPAFYFETHISGLGVPKAKQKANWQVELYFNPDLTGLDLYQLPNDPKGLPKLVPNWSIAQIGGGKTRISFESTTDGPQAYAFGKLQASLDPGSVAGTDAQPPVYDFDAARDSAVFHIPVKFKGTGFKTGNPMVLISTIPAGAALDPTGVSAPKVISKDYPSRTLVAAAGYADLTDSLRAARFYQQYLKAVAAEVASPAPKGQKKPFLLDSVSQSEFGAATEILDSDLSLSGADLAEMTVKVPIGKFFKDYQKYQDTGKASRSIEVEFTVFDGSRLARTRTFIRTRFRHADLQISEWYKHPEFPLSSPAKPHWNLFGYPWDEADSGSLARIVEKDKWDTENMRLMWYKGTGSGFGAYQAYDGTNPDAIRFDSGWAAWSGATKAYTPKCLVGMSLDYQPFRFDLNPGQFMDIALPFNFPIRWQDILDSSGISGSSAPALWHYNDSAMRWDVVEAADGVLMPWEGYTIKAATAQTLVFPVMDTSRSTTGTPKAAAKDGSWAARVEASDATASMALGIGRGVREQLFPEAPDIPGQDFRVALVKGQDKVSHYIQPLQDGWQGHWSLRVSAAKGSGGLSLRLLNASREVPVWLVETTHGTAVPLSADQPARIGEQDLQAGDYHLVAGDKAYVDGVMQSLAPGNLMVLTNHPNPFAGSTLIRYALPAGFGRTTFTMKVRDFRGRLVWERTIAAGNALSYLWDGRDRSGMSLPAGVYNLSLTAKPEGRPAYKAVRNLLRM